MRRWWVLALLLVVPAVHSGPNEVVARRVSGNWDMSRKLKGLPVLMVIRQDGNLYPSFWAGRNVEGKLTIRGREDDLTDELVIESEGGFVVKISHFPPKVGMEDVIPGGAWMRAGKALDLGMRFTRFTNWKRVEDRRNDDSGYTLEASFEATFFANGKSCPASGTARLLVYHKVGMFDLTATTTINGSDLGLAGNQAGPLQVKLKTQSPASMDLPPSGSNLQSIDIR